jgi:hypothetical protein
MWQLKEPTPVKLIVGILAANEDCLQATHEAVHRALGKIDLASDIWPFNQTDYYKDQTGPNILRQFVSIKKLSDLGKFTNIKDQTNSNKGWPIF